MSASLFWPANPCLSRREVHKRWICSSTLHQLFICRTDRSILPSSSPAQHFNPAGTNREIKKLKMRHDERGSQQSAGCGQVKRREELRTTEGRRAGWWFLISTGPLLHFLEHDAVFCWVKVRLPGEKKTLWVQHLLFILLIQPLICLHLSYVLKGKTHPRALELMSVQSLQVSRSHQFTHQKYI